MFAFLLFTVLWAFGAPLLAEGLCLVTHNTALGLEAGFIQLFRIGISNKVLRSLFASDLKEILKGPVIHTYITSLEDASSSIVLNVQTVASLQDLEVHITKPKSHARSILQPFKDFVNGDPLRQRNIYSIPLEGLTPSTIFTAQIRSASFELSHDFVFKTPPSLKNENDVIRLIVGGDVGNTEAGRHMTRVACSQRPDALFIGGDVAYDNGFTSCFACWDYFLRQIRDCYNVAGFAMPIILGVGNHDVGFSNFYIRRDSVRYDLPSLPPFFRYFPQHHTNSTTSRLPFFLHSFGNLHFFSLDSGYLYSTSKGPQREWFINSLKRITSTNATEKPVIFVQYHDPMYANFSVDGELKEAWLPLFEAYDVRIAFENHNHCLKRSKPIKELRKHEEDFPGVVFLGEGGWGARLRHIGRRMFGSWTSLRW
eukprot:TRINITY_DN4904_c0_g1_i6.p1 TRINITY_DN4904_c0_g1~~TRINITY_DN4904_c0_g1_i6.p1  ORF type:complete len:425 (+),score=65.05 TRINITY_DN4904_c0_g1_i6:384-1658(+)